MKREPKNAPFSRGLWLSSLVLCSETKGKLLLIRNLSPPSEIARKLSVWRRKETEWAEEKKAKGQATAEHAYSMTNEISSLLKIYSMANEQRHRKQMQMIGTRIKGDIGSRLLHHLLAEASIVSRDRDRWRFFSTLLLACEKEPMMLNWGLSAKIT